MPNKNITLFDFQKANDDVNLKKTWLKGEVIFKNIDTGEPILTVHNKVVIAGSQFVAQKVLIIVVIQELFQKILLKHAFSVVVHKVADQKVLQFIRFNIPIELSLLEILFHSDINLFKMIFLMI